MNLQGYEIDITTNSVDVKQDDSRSIKTRAYVSIPIIAFAVALLCFVMFTSHNGYSAWWDLGNLPRNSSDFQDALMAAFVATGLLGSFVLLGVRTFCPSGETLHCDRSTFTVSKIPWMNFSGRWKTQSFPITEISQSQFAVVQSGKGRSLCGICCLANGKKLKLFAGLEARGASHILRGLENLGAGVVHDPGMLTNIQETLRERRSRLDSR